MKGLVSRIYLNITRVYAGLRFGIWVWGFGFGIWGLRFGVWVWSLRFRVWGLAREREGERKRGKEGERERGGGREREREGVAPMDGSWLKAMLLSLCLKSAALTCTREAR